MNRIFTLLLGIILIALTQQLFSQCGTAINIPTLPVSGQALVCGTNFLNSTSVPGTICVSSGANGTGSEYYKNGNEALYTFTVPANGNYNISYTGQTWSSIILYNGCPTSGGTCVDGFTSTGSSKTLNVNLTTGITYYLWFDTWPSPDSPCPGTFSISLAGAGGPCASVTAMTCGTTYTGTLASTGSDWSTYTNCTYNEAGDEIVYSFTPTTTGSHTLTGTSTSGDPDFYLMSSCGNTGTNVIGACWDSGTQTVTLTAGTTYYFIVDNYSSSATAGYSISVTCPASGPCASVTAMTCGTTYTGTLASTGSDWSTYTNCTYNEAGDEIVYSFTPTTTGSHTLTGTSTSGDPDFYLMSSCGNTGTNVIGACWDSGTQTVTLTAGTTYYFIVDNYNSSATAGYSISVSCPSGGDPCTSVTPMTCGTVYTATLGTSNSDWDSYTDCGYAEPGDEMVFSFTPATTDAYTFTGTNTSGDADFFIMSTCGNTGTNILGYCWSLGDETVALTGGTTYYIIL